MHSVYRLLCAVLISLSKACSNKAFLTISAYCVTTALLWLGLSFHPEKTIVDALMLSACISWFPTVVVVLIFLALGEIVMLCMPVADRALAHWAESMSWHHKSTIVEESYETVEGREIEVNCDDT